MSDLWLTPAAPGAVPSTYLDRVRTLHRTVREWITTSAVAQSNDHLLENLPYIDLMFAFGFATLGDHATAKGLVEDARTVMEGPIPEGGNAHPDEAVTAALVRPLLFKAFEYRIGEARAGARHEGPLSPDVHRVRDELIMASRRGRVNSPHKLAGYVVDRFRERFATVEPDESPDPYIEWTSFATMLSRACAELQATRDANQLVDRVRRLWREGVSGSQPEEIHLRVLLSALPLSGRLGADCAMELLKLVPEVLRATSTNTSPDLPKRHSELVRAGLRLAARIGHGDTVAGLVTEFTAFVRRSADDVRFKLLGWTGGDCVLSLQQFGRRTELRALVSAWHVEFLSGATAAELRAKYALQPETWTSVLCSLLYLANGWARLGTADAAEPIFTVARRELFGPDAFQLPPKEYTDLARTYITALGGVAEDGLGAMNNLFREMPLKKITNTWVSARYYSRFHLELVEATVFAAYRFALDNPVPVTVTE